MRLTRQTNYAIRILMYCGSKQNMACLGEIARFYGISEPYLAKILGNLTKHGFVNSVRGRRGGIKLAMLPEDIRIGDVVQKLEENFEMAECFSPNEATCLLVSSCGLRIALGRALQSFFDVLNEYTLADLTDNKHKINAILGDYLLAEMKVPN